MPFHRGTFANSSPAVTRRDLLKISGAAGLGAGLVHRSVRGAAAKPRPQRIKSCRLSFYYGGPSHLDTYDITTIRAGTPMFLLARRIKALGIKMVMSGEGADETEDPCLGGAIAGVTSHSDSPEDGRDCDQMPRGVVLHKVPAGSAEAVVGSR